MSNLLPNKLRRWLPMALVLAVGLVEALAVALPVQADAIPPTNWPPVNMSQVPGASSVVTDPSGGATVGCPQQAGAAFASFGASGNQLQQQADGSFCAGNSAVGKDGTAYLVVNNGSSQLVRAWKGKGNALTWEYAIPCGPYAWPRAMGMGADGNLYMVVTGGSGACSGQQLIGLSATATAGKPQVVLNQALPGGNLLPVGMAAYGSGLVLYQSDGIRYVSYGGVFSNPNVVSDMMANYAGTTDDWFTASLGGRVFATSVANAASSLGCPDAGSVAASVSAIDPVGPAWTTKFSGCTYVREVHPMPSGGALLRIDSQPVAGGQAQESVLALGVNGATVWSKQYDALSYPSSRTITADTNGNVAVRTNLAVTSTIDGSTYQFPEINFELLSGTSGGVMSSLVLRGSRDSTSGPSYMWGSSQVAIANSTAYVAAYQCTTLSRCDMASTKLYAFKVSGLGMDYPRGAVLGYNPASTRVYAALGDSFSSGEGVPPFEDGSDVPLSAGPQQYDLCHRSNGAYARLLAGDAGLGLSAMKGTQHLFVACSGATTEQLNGSWPARKKDGSVGPNAKERPQKEALDPTVKIVTLSFGGNDAGFSDFVGRCLLADCSASATQDYFLGSKGTVTTLGPKLSQLYTNVLADAPNAKVYVMGYPQLLPTQGCSAPGTSGLNASAKALVAALTVLGQSNQVTANYLMWQLYYQGINLTQAEALKLVQNPSVTFSASEQAVAKQLVTALDKQISDAVRKVDAGRGRLVYIDPLASGSPFIGHELCTASPYFNGLVVNPLDLGHDMSYSFHPNAAGQAAYYQLARPKLAAK